jgi:hypothetical protein
MPGPVVQQAVWKPLLHAMFVEPTSKVSLGQSPLHFPLLCVYHPHFGKGLSLVGQQKVRTPAFEFPQAVPSSIRVPVPEYFPSPRGTARYPDGHTRFCQS